MATWTNQSKTNIPFIFTVSIESPAIFTKVKHGLIAGNIIRLESSGLLPTGLKSDTDYYVLSTGLTDDTFRVSLSLNGSVVNTTGSQSGTHQAIKIVFSKQSKNSSTWTKQSKL